MKRIAALIATGWLALAVTPYFRQGSLLFPSPKTWQKASPADAGLSFENLLIPVTPATHIHGWWIPGSSGQTLCVFHGNGYVLDEMVPTELSQLHATGANLLIIDYRGYGTSSPISPSESTLNEDALAALSYLERGRHIPEEAIFAFGRSIGSGPATALATHSEIAGLILESPFTNVREAAAAVWFTRLVPVGLILKSNFDNQAKIASVRAPILVISGTEDTLTPPWMARSLSESSLPEGYLLCEWRRPQRSGGGGRRRTCGKAEDFSRTEELAV